MDHQHLAYESFSEYGSNVNQLIRSLSQMDCQWISLTLLLELPWITLDPLWKAHAVEPFYTRKNSKVTLTFEKFFATYVNLTPF